MTQIQTADLNRPSLCASVRKHGQVVVLGNLRHLFEKGSRRKERRHSTRKNCVGEFGS